ncbi:MAG: transglutaminase domain-containing protein [Bacteroidaceae bacterium]|nr:transglutaminase domain-containing protein [Bacteroidaceae bacterium]
MKHILPVICLFLCSCSQYPGVPETYHPLLDEAFIKAEENADNLKKVLSDAPADQKEGIAFLISYMPERDLKSLSTDILLENVEYAYKARKQFPWAQTIPDSIFFNDVLPYVCLNETREAWRKDFFTRFSPYVQNCKTIYEAIDSINKNIRDELLVDYNTKRKRPDQSPSESISQGMASCSGLSILLTDALRAVGIPSRVAGTPNWHDNRGNHNWSEVWADGQWYFTEYYPDKQLNRAWFFADAGKATKGDRQHAIYAASFKPAETPFPLVWNRKINYVHAYDVTDRYISLYKDYIKELNSNGNHVSVKLSMYKNPKQSNHSDDRVATNVDVFRGKDQMGGGRTAGPTQDMNDMLEFFLEKNNSYTFKYTDATGKLRMEEVKIDDKPAVIKLYME